MPKGIYPRKIKSFYRQCLQCGQNILVFPYMIKTHKGFYCSRKCLFENQEFRNKFKIPFGHKVSQETKIKISQSNTGKKRSDMVKNKFSEMRKGKPWSQKRRNRTTDKFIKRKEQHWNWKGGITPINFLIRQSKQYKDWQKSVYLKNHWTCQICHIHCQKKNIIAHHVKSFAKFPELRFDINNGIVVCRKCHPQFKIIIDGQYQE